MPRIRTIFNAQGSGYQVDDDWLPSTFDWVERRLKDGYIPYFGESDALDKLGQSLITSVKIILGTDSLPVNSNTENVATIIMAANETRRIDCKFSGNGTGGDIALIAASDSAGNVTKLEDMGQIFDPTGAFGGYQYSHSGNTITITPLIASGAPAVGNLQVVYSKYPNS